MFGEIEVPAEVLTNNVIRCQAPLHSPGGVPFYVTCSNRLACSEIREFVYREKPSGISLSIAVNNTSEEEESFQIRLAKLLIIGSNRKWLDCSSPGCEKCKLKDTIYVSMGTFGNWDCKDDLIHNLLRHTLCDWLLCILHEHSKALDVLDEQGQGVIHLAAALGYDWALGPTVTAGFNPNFRDIRGRTALHWASQFGREKTVLKLIKLGAAPGAVDDPTTEFPGGRTAADLASSRGHKGIAGYLAEANLTAHLSSLTCNNNEIDNAVAITTDDDVDAAAQFFSSDQCSLRGSLAAIRNSENAAALIQARSFNDRQLTRISRESNDVFEVPLDAGALSSLNKGLRTSNLHTYAVKIQKRYRGWKRRNDFLQIRNNIIKIQVSSTPSAKPARDQNLLVLPATDIDAKEVSIKRKIEPKAPSTSKKNKSLIWDHVQKVEGEAGKFWVICNHCGFKRKHNSKQGTTVWKNHLERLHDVKYKNLQETPQMTGVENETKIDKFKDASWGPSVPTDADLTTELVDQRSSPWSTRNETQEIPISSAKCKEVSPAHDISEDIPEQTKTTLVKGTNWSFDEQSDHENLNGWNFEYHEFERCQSEKVVFTVDDIAAGSKHWENALVGYVLGLKPTLAEMACFAKTEWERFEVPKVFLVDDGVFLFAFESLDKKRIVLESQWAYSDHLLVLREWTCDLDVHNVEVLRRVPIWVEFPKLPLVLWNPKSLGRLARHLGRPLATDKSTKNPQNQLKCARVLIEVEVDTMDKLPLSIPVDLPSKSFNQTVVFDRESVKNSFIASKKAGGTTVLICGYTSEEKNLLEQWRKHKSIGKIVTTVGTIDVTDTSLARLVPPQENVTTKFTQDHELHIDDTVIDAYFHLLKTRCNMHPNKYRKYHFFSSFMAKKILDGNTKDLSKKWYTPETSVCKLFLPVHLPKLNHWVLFCVDVEDRQLLWMDSYKGLHKFYEKERDIISEWFVGTLLPDMGYKEANWDVKVRDDIPKQKTDFDCGVFVMKYADCLTQGDCFPFSQSDMVLFRKRIFLDICFGNVNAP